MLEARISGQGAGRMKSLYLESLQLVERLHRSLLEVIRDEFERSGRCDLTAVQALLLFHIDGSELTAGALRARGFYPGTNASYTIRKLVELGFIHHERSTADRRSVRIRLTAKGREVAAMVARLCERHVGAIEEMGGISAGEVEQMNRALQRLDRFWNDTITYRM